MAFKKSLASALAYASVTICDGREVDVICHMPNSMIRLESADDFSVELADQEITIDSSGEAIVTHVDDHCNTETLHFEFKVMIPIREVDFA